MIHVLKSIQRLGLDELELSAALHRVVKPAKPHLQQLSIEHVNLDSLPLAVQLIQAHKDALKVIRLGRYHLDGCRSVTNACSLFLDQF